MWTWVPAFLAASVAVQARRVSRSPASGVVSWPRSARSRWAARGASGAGGRHDRWGTRARDDPGDGRQRALRARGRAASTGAACSLLAPFVLLWGFFVVADSAQFSAMVTEAAPPHAVGTALTLQTSLGFLLTMVTIQLVPVLADAVGWRLAFVVLALGPAAGIAAIRRLGRLQPSPQRRPYARPAA